MKLDKNSRAARLYRWFYCVNEYNMPKSLCPYAWKLLLMWILIVPYTLFSLPFQIKNKFQTEPIPLVLKSAFAINCFILIASLMALGLSTLAFGMPDSLLMQNLANAGLFLSLSVGVNICVIILLVIGMRAIDVLSQYIYTSKRTPRESQASVVKEFIKAKINKYCPKIDWE